MARVLDARARVRSRARFPRRTRGVPARPRTRARSARALARAPSQPGIRRAVAAALVLVAPGVGGRERSARRAGRAAAVGGTDTGGHGSAARRAPGLAA